MPTIPPYKLARLVNQEHPICDDTNKRWYIVFYVWNTRTCKLEKKRDYSINKLKTKKERLIYAKKFIAEINQLLAEGATIGTEEPKGTPGAAIIDAKRDYTVEAAFKAVLPLIKSQKRPATYNAYKSASDLFLEFCRRHGWDKFNIRSICKNDIISWLNAAQMETTISNVTRNNNLYHLKPVFTVMIANGLIAANPSEGIPRLDEDEPARIAFSEQQLQTLKAAIAPDKPRLWLFMQFMLYGFIRPKEIGLLRVGNINLEKRSIYIPGSISKNRRSAYIRISPPFAGYIQQLELEKYSPNDYVFGKDLLTGPYLLPRGFGYKLFIKYLNDLKFGEGYDFYCIKHTGVILHYRAGVDIKSLQEQLRHVSLDETDKYLRSLGLFSNKEIEDKSPII